MHNPKTWFNIYVKFVGRDVGGTSYLRRCIDFLKASHGERAVYQNENSLEMSPTSHRKKRIARADAYQECEGIIVFLPYVLTQCTEVTVLLRYSVLNSVQHSGLGTWWKIQLWSDLIRSKETRDNRVSEPVWFLDRNSLHVLCLTYINKLHDIIIGCLCEPVHPLWIGHSGIEHLHKKDTQEKRDYSR